MNNEQYKINIAVGKCEFNQFYICISFDAAYKNVFRILSDGVYANTLARYTHQNVLSIADAKQDENICGVSRFFYKVTSLRQHYNLQPFMDDVLNDYCEFLSRRRFDYTILNQQRGADNHGGTIINYEIELRLKT